MLAGLLLLISTAAAFDHSGWQSTLDKYRRADARVDYAGIGQSGALDGYMAALGSATVPTSRAEKMAFWINAYNAMTVNLVAQSWPIGSMQELDGGQVWTTRQFTVAGQPLTLDQIEKNKIVPLGDPRIHLVLNCASMGCPPLNAKAFTTANLEAQLALAGKSWLPGKGVSVNTENNELILSSVFDWYASDFPDPGGAPIPGVPGRLQGPLKFIAPYLPEAKAGFVLAGGYSTRFYPFSWTVNST
jgi:hypothetical protein